MSKNYSTGNQHGHEDGKQGDNRLASRSVNRLLKADQVFPGAENRHDEYRRGYVNGFEDEVRVKHVTSPSESNSTHTTIAKCQPTCRIIVIPNLLCKFMGALPPTPQGIYTTVMI